MKGSLNSNSKRKHGGISINGTNLSCCSLVDGFNGLLSLIFYDTEKEMGRSTSLICQCADQEQTMKMFLHAK